jgi:hypothetical protein
MECSGLVCQFVLNILTSDANECQDLENKALEVLIYELYWLVSDILSYKKIDGKR